MPTVKELKQLCKDKSIKGYSKLNKPDLEKLCVNSKKVNQPVKYKHSNKFSERLFTGWHPSEKVWELWVPKNHNGREEVAITKWGKLQTTLIIYEANS